MNLNLNMTSVKNFLREAAAVAGLFVGLANTLHLGGAAQATLLAVSGWIIQTSHQVDKNLAAGVATTTTTVVAPDPTKPVA